MVDPPRAVVLVLRVPQAEDLVPEEQEGVVRSFTRMSTWSNPSSPNSRGAVFWGTAPDNPSLL